MKEEMLKEKVKEILDGYSKHEIGRVIGNTIKGCYLFEDEEEKLADCCRWLLAEAFVKSYSMAAIDDEDLMSDVKHLITRN